MKKKMYLAPCVLKAVTVEPGASLLAGSVVTKDTGVKTVGQEEVTFDFSATTFNQDWETSL